MGRSHTSLYRTRCLAFAVGPRCKLGAVFAIDGTGGGDGDRRKKARRRSSGTSCQWGLVTRTRVSAGALQQPPSTRQRRGRDQPRLRHHIEKIRRRIFRQPLELRILVQPRRQLPHLADDLLVSLVSRPLKIERLVLLEQRVPIANRRIVNLQFLLRARAVAPRAPSSAPSSARSIARRGRNPIFDALHSNTAVTPIFGFHTCRVVFVAHPAASRASRSGRYAATSMRTR